jgi:tRNA 2-selenouridine synthase
MPIHIADANDLHRFDTIIDVRTPAEFAEDHIPGAINCPVLSNAERAEVGTLYKQSPFEGRKRGAALISANIAQILQAHFALHAKSWLPLVYCWRGGMRSGSLATVMASIGWPVHQLKGGYKAYRHRVITELDSIIATLKFIVLCGPTGSGKSKYLQSLAQEGHQVLDLEALANHRGSILGLLPGTKQPAQRLFETMIWETITQFHPDRPVYIEAESRRIGKLFLPDALYHQMHKGECLLLEVPMVERVRFLCEEYAFFCEDPILLQGKLGKLAPVISKQKLSQWLKLIEARAFPLLVETLLDQHYDPLYWRSMTKHYPQLNTARVIALEHL